MLGEFDEIKDDDKEEEIYLDKDLQLNVPVTSLKQKESVSKSNVSSVAKNSNQLSDYLTKKTAFPNPFEDTTKT